MVAQPNGLELSQTVRPAEGPASLAGNVLTGILPKVPPSLRPQAVRPGCPYQDRSSRTRLPGSHVSGGGLPFENQSMIVSILTEVTNHSKAPADGDSHGEKLGGPVGRRRGAKELR